MRPSPETTTVGRPAQAAALSARYAARLERWAAERLPAGARTRVDLPDLVQRSIASVVADQEGRPTEEATTLAQVRDEVHAQLAAVVRARRRRVLKPPDAEPHLAADLLERYEASLHGLADDDRQAIVTRLELTLPWPVVTVLLGRRSIKAARFLVSRALLRLAKGMAQ